MSYSINLEEILTKLQSLETDVHERRQTLIQAGYELAQLISSHHSYQDRTLYVFVSRGGLLLLPGFLCTLSKAHFAICIAERKHHQRQIHHLSVPSENYERIVIVDALSATGRTIVETKDALTHILGGATMSSAIIACSITARLLLDENQIEVLSLFQDTLDGKGIPVPDFGGADAGEVFSGSNAVTLNLHETFPSEAFAEAHQLEHARAKRRNDEIYKHIVEIVAGLQPAQILDVGCGSGDLSILLAPLCQNLTGVDPSLAAINAAMVNCGRSNIKYVAGNVDSLPLDQYQVVVCCMVLNSTSTVYDLLEQVRLRCSAGATQIWTILHPAFNFNESITQARRNLTPENFQMSYECVPSYSSNHTFRKVVGRAVVSEHHRPISEYIRLLHLHGFQITNLIEPDLPFSPLPRVLTLVSTTA